MGKGVIPVQFVFVRVTCAAIVLCGWQVRLICWRVGMGNLVAITFDDAQFKIEPFLNAEDNVALEKDHALDAPEQFAGRNVHKRRATNAGVTLRQGVDECLVRSGRGERIRHKQQP